MKKVLLYTDTPIAGGAELQMFLLAKFLNKNQYSPTLCCSDFPQLKEWQEKFKKEGIEVITLKVAHKHDPRHFTKLKKILSQFDLLHCHIWNPASCRYALAAGKATKTPIVTTEHDPFPLHGIKNLIKKNQLKNINQIISISTANKELLAKLYPSQKDKLIIVSNGIDIAEFEAELNKVTNNNSLNLITCIAALHKRKGINFLIEAFSKLPAQYNQYTLQLVGSGPDEAEFKELAAKSSVKDRIKFLGQRSGVSQILKNSNFFVLPSIREGFGLVLLEAMCAKVPILATKTGGITDIIRSEENGILVDPQNSETLKKGLIKLLEMPQEQLNKMTELAYKNLTSKFTAKKMAENTEKVYQCAMK